MKNNIPTLYILQRDSYVVKSQPRTQVQITKNRHTTVFLYRSVAKLSERAGVLGEDSVKEAPGRLCIKHGRQFIIRKFK